MDTQVYDVFSSPAMQNFGNSRYVDDQGNIIGDGYTYVTYSEGIYVGYRYYETRYEDSIMGTDNVGDYDYEQEVAFPFGYGMSYTDFTWSNYTMSEQDGVITVSVDVENSGDAAGKDVLEVYFQSPYTDYDRDNGVEKSAVELAAFAKTDLLEPGETQTVTATFDVDDMKSYDAQGAQTYIMDEGTYYVTAARDAHQAVNNMLTAKGYDVDDDSASADMVASYEVDALRTLDTDDATGATVTNLFDDALAEDAEYLTRSNWTMMDDNGIAYSTSTAVQDGVTYPTHEADDELIANIDATGWEASGRPADADNNDDVTVDTDRGLELVDMVGLDYDDPQWEQLLDELKVSEMHLLYNKSGFNTPMIESVNKPATADTDGPAGLANFMSGWGSFNYSTDYMLASTWNVDLAQQMGELVGEDGLRSNTVGWYAPAMNMHRTPFGGRGFEYYSEDPMLSGAMGTAECLGATSKGLVTYIKHFALNEQETNRSSVATWANEQTIREIYLKPFEMSIKEGNANGLMDSMNRLGFRYTRGYYALLTSLLRVEWGFTGTVITDAANVSPEAVNDMCLSAGTDLQLTTGQNKLSDTKSNRVRNALREASKHTLYAFGNSAAMNGITRGSNLSAGNMAVYQVILIAIDVLAALALAVGEWFVIRRSRLEAPVLTAEQKRAKLMRGLIILGAVVVVLAAAGIGLYFYIDSQMISTV
ncbi:glycoside hydrolase family 3 N-terminal domain-containing protein [Bifidobacterium lemurum]|uniref:glycoside hydrolase family 3 N-terminal domain-containing protein n=1 Tax=Bifidobacterium lemurum TaxID=1603886 RepID=UPI001867A73E|nr:glycoside hydrolase family 3 N-terminal domain-containing protein [Bifidobacterium lemurum]QOL34781.1 fibronectin type III-like domain-contianing protein [Bifidobacterium lemurum]